MLVESIIKIPCVIFSLAAVVIDPDEEMIDHHIACSFFPE